MKETWKPVNAKWVLISCEDYLMLTPQVHYFNHREIRLWDKSVSVGGTDYSFQVKQSCNCSSATWSSRRLYWIVLVLKGRNLLPVRYQSSSFSGTVVVAAVSSSPFLIVIYFLSLLSFAFVLELFAFFFSLLCHQVVDYYFCMKLLLSTYFLLFHRFEAFYDHCPSWVYLFFHCLVSFPDHYTFFSFFNLFFSLFFLQLYYSGLCGTFVYYIPELINILLNFSQK